MPVYLSSQSFGGNAWAFFGGALLVIAILGVGLYLDITKGQGRK